MISQYFISISQRGAINKETIHDPETKLKLEVNMVVGFKPKKGEKHYFVSGNDDTLLAFETQGYKAHKNLLILEMIARYCVYLGFVEPQIHSTWPGIK